jgi:hypothetical protein
VHYIRSSQPSSQSATQPRSRAGRTAAARQRRAQPSPARQLPMDRAALRRDAAVVSPYATDDCRDPLAVQTAERPLFFTSTKQGFNLVGSRVGAQGSKAALHARQRELLKAGLAALRVCAARGWRCVCPREARVTTIRFSGGSLLPLILPPSASFRAGRHQ